MMPTASVPIPPIRYLRPFQSLAHRVGSAELDENERRRRRQESSNIFSEQRGKMGRHARKAEHLSEAGKWISVVAPGT
jgi:hypothetical protein